MVQQHFFQTPKHGSNKSRNKSVQKLNKAVKNYSYNSYMHTNLSIEGTNITDSAIGNETMT